MKNKIIVLLAVVSLFVASCDSKKTSENQEGVKSDSTTVKSDSTTTAPQDTVKSK